MIYSQFLKKWLYYLLISMIGIMSFNYCINPFDLFATPRVRNLNASKPSAGTRTRMAKPYRVTQIKPQILITGNSRPEMALNPEHSCFTQTGLQAYNLALSGSSLYMQSRYLQHALTSNSVQQVFHALGFLNFLPNKAAFAFAPLDAEIEERLLVTVDGQINTSHGWRSLLDHTQSLLSTDALYSSLSTLFLQGREQFSTRTELGFYPSDAHFKAIIKREGQWPLFEHKLLDIYEKLGKKQHTLLSGEHRWSDHWRALNQIIDSVERSGAKLTLYIDPYHAEYLEVIYRAGFGDLFEQWKYKLSKIASQHQIPLYDFSDYDHYSTEIPLKEEKETDSIQWFWEPSHYRKELGDRMLETLLHELCPQQQATSAPQFGRRLTPASAAEFSTLFRKKRQLFISQHTQLIEYIDQLKLRIED